MRDYLMIQDELFEQVLAIDDMYEQAKTASKTTTPLPDLKARVSAILDRVPDREAPD
jgi:hypothetical protein